MDNRLLTIEEIANKTAGHTEAESLLIVRNLQDAGTSKWWIEEIEKRDLMLVCERVEQEWQALKKQIGGG